MPQIQVCGMALGGRTPDQSIQGQAPPARKKGHFPPIAKRRKMVGGVTVGDISNEGKLFLKMTCQ